MRPLPSGARSAASVAVLCGAGLVPSLLATAPIPVLAELAATLGSDSDSASWILTAMFVSAAVTTPIAGRAADLYGGRRVLLVTTALVTLGSVICAVADALPMMAVGRAMTGAGAGAIPVGIGLMRVVVGPAALRMGTAAMSVTVGVGGALALPVSAVLARCGGPQLIFWVAAGVGLCLFCGIVGLIPADPPRPVRRQRFDVAGALGLVVTLPLLLVVPARLPYWGVLTVPTLGGAGAGVMCAWWWIRAQRRRRDPLVDVRAAAAFPMRWLHLTSLLVGVMLMVSMIACSRLLQEPAATGGIGLSALAAALLLTPGGIAMLAAPPLVSRLSQVLRAELLPAAGAVIALLGYLGLIVQRDQAWQVCVWATVVCAGVGTAMSATPMLVTERTAPGSMASAQAVHALARFFGTAIASATVGLVVGAPAAPGEFSLIFGVGAGAAAAAIACGAVMGRARPSSAPFTVS